MNNIKIVESAIGAIYHEVGHLFGYCLANFKEDTFLGEISEFSIGIKKCFVGVDNSFYHFQNLKQEKQRIIDNTINKKRTIAWFIEVISGCTIQAIFESKNFEECFGFEQQKGGYIDYCNILALTSISSFKFNMHDIFDLQTVYNDFLIKYELVNNFEKIVNEIKQELIKSDDIQLYFTSTKIDVFCNKLSALITTELYADYLSLIENFQR